MKKFPFGPMAISKLMGEIMHLIQFNNHHLKNCFSQGDFVKILILLIHCRFYWGKGILE